MIRYISPRVIDVLENGTPKQRRFICNDEFIYFAIYYFREFFEYQIPGFHFRMYNDLKRLMADEIDFLMWVMFRESAKTSIAKMFVVWCICYRKRRFINFDSYDKDNAEASTFDIANWLISNKRIIRDFGQLYIERKHDDKKTMKRLNEFITTNGVKVKAYSTQESTRGRIYDRFRPDLYVVDDFETSKTKQSMPITEKIGEHLDELKGGLAVGAKVIYLCNLITEAGNVYKMIEAAKEDPRMKVRRVDVVMDDQIQWPDKYVATDKEAAEIMTKHNKQVVSLEAKKRSLNAGGKRVYEVEMMNNPAAAGSIVFDRQKIDEMLEDAKPPVETLAGLRMWERYNPKHRYAIGADTAKGVGRDHNASVAIDFSTMPSKVVATYKNNEIAPDTFAYELKRQGDIYGSCLIAPEKNNTGWATLTQLKQIYKNIFAQVPKDKKVNTPSKNPELGWETNRATRPEMIYQLKSAVEDGLLDIMDEELLLELKKYTQEDLEDYSEKTTRHFDMLMACAIAWAMRDFAKVTEAPKKKWKQSEWERSSEYEG